MAGGRDYVRAKELNYSRTQLGPVYRTIGIPVVLTVGGVDYNLRFLDKTSGVSLSGPIEIETIRPAAVARVSDIIAAGLTIDQLDQRSNNLLMNGKDYRISSIKSLPSPAGENDGEVYMFLEGR